MLFPGGFFLLFGILLLVEKKYFISRYTEKTDDLIYSIIGDF